MGRMAKTLWVVLLVVVVRACTIAVFAPDATEYGRPMLWKNRDVPNYRQQYIFVAEEHSFIAITYQGVYDQVYGGVNDAGFGIVNTDTYNHGPNTGRGLSDGQVMYLALAHCESVWDFLGLLDSLLADSAAGLRSTHCYGIIDQYGNAGVVEANCESYVYFSANAMPDHYLVRTNFAISGDSSNRIGYERYMRARALFDTLLPVSVSDVWSVASDLVSPELNPYPLPYEGTYDGLPTGYIPTDRTINRFLTTSYQIIIGKNFGDNIDFPVLWAGFSQPYYTIPVPMWVGMGSVPPDFTGTGNYFCEESKFLHDIVYDRGYWNWFNSYAGDFISDYFAETREQVWGIFAKYLLMWQMQKEISSEEIVQAEDDIISLVGETYAELHGLWVREHPVVVPREITLSAQPNPFNASTVIEFNLPFPYEGLLEISDLSGRVILSRQLGPADTRFVWTPESSLPSGIYLARVVCGGHSATQKLYLIK